MRCLVTLVLAALLDGCSALSVSMSPEPDVAHPPRAENELVPRRVALVLSGGSARGFAHIGVIRVLEEAGIRPDLVVGASAGAIVGALYAGGYDARALNAAAEETGWELFGEIEMSWNMLGVVRGTRIQSFVNRHLGNRRFEQLPIPFVAVATDVNSGELVAFNRGDVGNAVRASSALPGIFAPVTIDGRRFADGSIVSPLPVATARRLGAEIVIAVDVVYSPIDTILTGPVAMVFQTFLIQTHRLKEFEAREADIAFGPTLRTSGQYTFADRAYLISEGERAARAALPTILDLIAKSAQTK